MNIPQGNGLETKNDWEEEEDREEDVRGSLIRDGPLDI